MKLKHVGLGWALLIAVASVGCEHLRRLEPIILPPSPPPVTPPPAPEPPPTPPPTPAPSPITHPAPGPIPEPSPTATPQPAPSASPCVPQVVPGEPGCTRCLDALGYLERQGYFRDLGNGWYQSDNCGAGNAGAKCEFLNVREHLGFPACSVWRSPSDPRPKRGPEGDTCIPRTVPCASPAPGPSAPPAGTGSCTAAGLGIVKVGIGSLGCNDGGKCHWHATVRFGTGAGTNGKPCDGAHPPCGQEQPGSQCEPCGGAICDPTTGATWSASGGLQIFGTEENGYRVTTKGRGRLTACPAPNPVTAAGEPLRVHGSACTSVEVTP